MKVLLIAAIFVAFILRFWHLTSLPYPPDGDEVAFGYYGWSLLHFGTDEYGKFLPQSFSSIGDFKYPGLAYMNMIPALIFGLNNITTRILSAISGVVLVLLVYWLTDFLFSKKFLAITAAWFIALSPWGIIESRLGFESMISTTLTTAALVCMLKIFKSKKLKHPKIIWGVTLLLFLISVFTYAASRLFIPLMLFGMLGISFLKGGFLSKHKKKILFLLACLGFIVFLSLLSPQNRGRAGDDAVKGISSSEEDRLQQLYIGAGTSFIKIPPRVTWFFQNKYRVALFDFLERYFDHLTPGFLFLRGELNLHAVPDMGVLLFCDIFFLFFGVLYILKSDKEHGGKFVLVWLLIAPIPSALTTSGAAMNRAILMIVPLSILSAYGFYVIYNFFTLNYRKIVLGVLVFGVMVSSLYSFNQIFIQKPLDRPWFKQTVNENLTREILKLKGNYRAVVTPDDDYIFFLFYGKVSPRDFLSDASIEPISQAKWDRVDRFQNIYFKMPFDCPKGGKLHILYVCRGIEVPQNAKIIETFYYPD